MGIWLCPGLVSSVISQIEFTRPSGLIFLSISASLCRMSQQTFPSDPSLHSIDQWHCCFLNSYSKVVVEDVKSTSQRVSSWYYHFSRKYVGEECRWLLKGEGEEGGGGGGWAIFSRVALFISKIWTYGKAGNANEMETGNKTEMENGKGKMHHSLVQCFLLQTCE